MIDPAPPRAETEGGEEQSSIGNVPWSVLDAIAVPVIWLVALSLVGGFALLAAESLFPQTPRKAFELAIAQLFLIATVLTYVRVRHPGAVGRLFGPERPSVGAVLLGFGAGMVAFAVFGVGLALVMQLIANALQSPVPEVQEGFRELAQNERAAPLLVFGAVVVGPFAEELFYRGMLFTAFRRRLPLWPAMGLSGTLFAIAHVEPNLDGYLRVLIIIIPLGMFLAWVYERRGTLVVPVLAHATFNLVQVVWLIRSGGQV